MNRSSSQPKDHQLLTKAEKEPARLFWYVAYSKPRSEKKVAERLTEAGINTYCPTYVSIRQWSDRKKKVSVPVFTSYVFIQISLKRRSVPLSDPGLLNYVHHLGKPAIIADDQMERLQLMLGDIKQEDKVVVRSLRPSDRVTIQQGPLLGQTGTIKQTTQRKVFVVLDALQVVVEIEQQAVQMAT